MYNLETNFLNDRPDLKKPTLSEKFSRKVDQLKPKLSPKLERFGKQVSRKTEYISRRLPEKLVNGKEALIRAYKVGKATDLTRQGWGQEIPKVVGEMLTAAKDPAKALSGEKAFRNGDVVKYLSKAEKVETSISEDGRQSILSALGLLNTNNLDNKSEIPSDTLSLRNLEEICFQLGIDWIPNQMKEAIIQATREVNAEFASRNGVGNRGGNRMSSRDIASKLLMGALDKYVNDGSAILEARSSKYTEVQHIEALKRGRKYGHLINREGGSVNTRDQASSAGLPQGITVRSVVASWLGIVSNDPKYRLGDLNNRQTKNADRPRSTPPAVEPKPLTPEELAELARIKTENLKTLNELMLGAGAKGGQGVLELAQIEDDSDLGTQNLTYLDQDNLDNKLARLSDSQITQEELKEIVSQLPTKADLYSVLERFENLVQADTISNQEVISWFVEAVNNRKGVEAKDVPIPESDLEPLPRTSETFELEIVNKSTLEEIEETAKQILSEFQQHDDGKGLVMCVNLVVGNSAIADRLFEGIAQEPVKESAKRFFEMNLKNASNADIVALIEHYQTKKNDSEEYKNFITNFVEILEELKVKRSREVMSPPDRIFAGNGANITVTESLNTGNPEEESQETQNNQKLNAEINRYLLDVGEEGGAFGVSNLVRELQGRTFGDTPDLVTLNKLKNIISSLQAGGDKIAENPHLAKLQPVYNSIKIQFDSLAWNANSNQIKPVAKELQRLLADLQTKINLPQVPSAPIFTSETPVLIPEPQITEVPFAVVSEVETPTIVRNDSTRPRTVIEPSISTVETKVAQDKSTQLNLLNELLKAGLKDRQAIGELLRDPELRGLKSEDLSSDQIEPLKKLLIEIEKNVGYQPLITANLEQFNNLKGLAGIEPEVTSEVSGEEILEVPPAVKREVTMEPVVSEVISEVRETPNPESIKENPLLGNIRGRMKQLGFKDGNEQLIIVNDNLSYQITLEIQKNEDNQKIFVVRYSSKDSDKILFGGDNGLDNYLDDMKSVGMFFSGNKVILTSANEAKEISIEDADKTIQEIFANIEIFKKSDGSVQGEVIDTDEEKVPQTNSQEPNSQVVTSMVSQIIDVSSEPVINDEPQRPSLPQLQPVELKVVSIPKARPALRNPIINPPVGGSGSTSVEKPRLRVVEALREAPKIELASSGVEKNDQRLERLSNQAKDYLDNFETANGKGFDGLYKELKDILKDDQNSFEDALNGSNFYSLLDDLQKLLNLMTDSLDPEFEKIVQEATLKLDEFIKLGRKNSFNGNILERAIDIIHNGLINLEKKSY